MPVVAAAPRSTIDHDSPVSRAMSNDHVRLVDVSPRDGLQNESVVLPTAAKIELIDRLAAAGVTTIEATSFVDPRRIPQLADASDVLQGLRRRPGVTYPVLVPNERGYERARAAGATAIAVFTAASEAFNRKNINCSIDESIERFRPVMERARADGVSVRGYVSTVWGCPYQGAVPVEDAVRTAEALHALGCHEISLGDTIGAAHPEAAASLVRALAARVSITAIAVHFHDTHGRAVDNIRACLDEGVRVVDGSVGGVGGCPYANGATGNVASERVVALVHACGLSTGIDAHRLAETGQWLTHLLGRPHKTAPHPR